MNKKEELKKQIEFLQKDIYLLPKEKQRARQREITCIYEELITIEEDPYFSCQALGNLYHVLEEYKKAESCYLKMLQQNSGSTSVYGYLADVYFETQQYELALKTLDECIRISFGADFRYEFRAKINLALGNLEEAAKDQKIYDDYQAREKAKWDDPNHYYHYK